MIEIKGGGGLWNSVFGGDNEVSLRSRAILKILFLMSEGEIAGFPSGDDIRKYIYVSDTAVMNADGTENFRGVKVAYRSGTQFQSAIPGVNQGGAAPVAVGVKVTKSGNPIVRTINSPQAGQIRVSLTTPGLSSTDGEGYIHFSEAKFKIYLSTNGSPFVLKVDDGFYGRTSGGYTRDYTLDVTGAGPWQIKVERTNDDVAVNDTKTQNDLYWQSYTPIVEQRFRYPNSALLYIEFDSAYFKAQPSITVKTKGVICRIPSNYDPIARTYTGLWNGTFTRAWTNNPAWCLLELLTNTRFGMGNYISLASVDKWSLYQIAVYCDGLVSNGFGGQEPRFVYNNYLNTKTDAFAAISALLGQIRGVAYYAGGQILFNQDRPSLTGTVDAYTQANTVCEYDEDGVLTQPNFTYDYVSLKEKHSKCHVFWYDPNEFGKKKTAYIDLFDIGYGADFYRYGDEVKEVDLPGCTSEAEARRHGRWILLSERLESKTVSFATGEEGLLRFPGDLVRIVDEHETVNRIGGRIESATINTVILDAPVAIGTLPTYLGVLIDGVKIGKLITNAAGTHTNLTLSTNFATIPEPNAVWFVNDGTVGETYRIISISNPSLGKYGMVGVLHMDKYSAIDSLESLTGTTPDRTIPLAPTNLTVTGIPNGYFIGWSASLSPGIVSYQLQYEQENSNYWQPIVLSAGVTDAEIILPVGAYKFRVSASNIYGKTSAWAYSGLNYATAGSILSFNPDGSIILSTQVNMVAGIEYFLNTYCSEPAGYSSPSLPNPYQDRRKVVSAPGVTNQIYVSPSYLGDQRILGVGSYPDLEMYNPVSYLKLTDGSAAIYDGVDYTGTSAIIAPGAYINAVGQAPPKSVIVSGGGILSISQFAPGKNPLPSSTWQLTTAPLDSISANGFPITIGGASTTAITI